MWHAERPGEIQTKNSYCATNSKSISNSIVGEGNEIMYVGLGAAKRAKVLENLLCILGIKSAKMSAHDVHFCYDCYIQQSQRYEGNEWKCVRSNDGKYTEDVCL